MPLEVALRDGAWDLVARDLGWVRLRGVRPQVEILRRGRAETWQPQLQPAADAAARARENGLDLVLEVRPQGDALIITARLRNDGSETVRLRALSPIALGADGACEVGSGVDRWSVFRQGYQSWTGTRSFRIGETDRDPLSGLMKIVHVDLRHPSPARPGHFRSDQFAAVENLRSGEALVAGFLGCRRAFGGIDVAVDGDRCTRFSASLDYDDVALEPGREVETEPLWIATAFGARRLLAQYAGAAGAWSSARLPENVPAGWCSWYYYFTHVSEQRVVENLEALVRSRGRVPCEYVQVDDGYQAAIGDWTTANEKFPHGMAWLAEKIRTAGFDAGLWTAPFIARPDSQLFARHPEWFVRNRLGRPRFALWNPPWGLRACYALDTTHPEVLDWLRRTFRTIGREWGYRILKLDFLFAAALPGRRHDAGATRAEALRRGLEAVREGAGEESFLLGCGCPLGPAVGVVDAMRIGPDVTPYWSNAFSRIGGRDLHGLATKHAVRNTLTRAFLHRRWWLNDPDCLMVRDTNTHLSLEEIRSLATAIAITDGMVVLSDRVEKLAPERIDLLQRALCLRGAEGEIFDLMQSDIPEIAVARLAGETAVAVFNHADRPRRRIVDLVDLVDLELSSPAGAPLRELWTGRVIEAAGERVDLGEIPAHGCRVLLVPGFGRNLST